MGALCPQKGVEHALDHICDSLNFVVVGIYWWLFGWLTDSYRAGRCHHRRGDPSYSGTKGIVAIWTLAGEGEVFGKSLVINHFTIKFTERSHCYEKEKYRYPLFSASYSDHHLCGLCIDAHTRKAR